MRLALFEPDIPQNVGAMLRTAACLGVPVDLIGPCGFPFSDRALRRAGMDYAAEADLTEHASYADFQAARGAGRLVLLTTAGDTPFHDAAYLPRDTLMVGRESAGVPDHVHADADLRVVIPMATGRDGRQLRSLNVAAAAAMVLGEALRQTALLPGTRNILSGASS